MRVLISALFAITLFYVAPAHAVIDACPADETCLESNIKFPLQGNCTKDDKDGTKPPEGDVSARYSTLSCEGTSTKMLKPVYALKNYCLYIDNKSKTKYNQRRALFVPMGSLEQFNAFISKVDDLDNAQNGVRVELRGGCAADKVQRHCDGVDVSISDGEKGAGTSPVLSGYDYRERFVCNVAHPYQCGKWEAQYISGTCEPPCTGCKCDNSCGDGGDDGDGDDGDDGGGDSGGDGGGW